MNILILINSAPYKQFFYYCGKELERRGHQVFYAVDSLRSHYVEPLPEVDSHQNTVYFDQFFEKNYYTEFNSLYSCTWGGQLYSEFDRFLTHDFNLDKNKYYWKQLKECLGHFFYQVINNNKIDLVLYENISNGYAYAAWRVCQLLGKQYVGLMCSRIPGRFEMQSSIIEDEISYIRKLINKPISSADVDWFNSYRKNIVNIQPDYMKNNGLDNVSLKKLIHKDKIIRAWRYLTVYNKYDYFFDYQVGNLRKKFLSAIKVAFSRRYNAQKAEKYYLLDDEIKNAMEKEIYCVYPMHYHPESSTSILAPTYTNEYTNILNIANNLPFGVYLYVKDHVSAKGVQNSEFYKKIGSLPNVRLIHWKKNIKSIMQKAIAVVTINSTAGFEALLLGKPVLLFGRVFYEEFPGVKKICHYSELQSLFEIINQLKYSPSDLLPWFVAYKEYTLLGELKMSNINEFNEKYYIDLVDQILNRLKLKMHLD